MNRFSRQFQKSTENTTCELYEEVSRLVKLYAKNLLKTDAILAADTDLTKLKLDVEKTSSYSAATALKLAKRFPQMGLSDKVGYQSARVKMQATLCNYSGNYNS